MALNQTWHCLKALNICLQAVQSFLWIKTHLAQFNEYQGAVTQSAFRLLGVKPFLFWTPLVIVKDQSSHLVYISPYMHKILTCEYLNSIRCRSCERIAEEKALVAQVVCAFRCLTLETLSWGLKFNSNIWVRNYFFLKKCVHSEGTVSYNVLN